MASSQTSTGLVTAYGSAPPPGSGTRVSFDFWAQPVYTASDGTYFCPGFDGPTFSTNPWDYIQIGTIYGTYTGGSPPDKTPGICRLRVGKGYEVDTKKPIGSNGSRNTAYGMHNAGTMATGGSKMPFDIEIEIWTPEQLRQLTTMWKFFVPPGGKGSPTPFDAKHPALGTHGIAAIQFISAEGPVVGRDRRGTFTIRAMEFSLPNSSNAISTPTSATGGVAPLGTVYGAPGSNAADVAPR